jgi:hypothetical protein
MQEIIHTDRGDVPYRGIGEILGNNMQVIILTSPLLHSLVRTKDMFMYSRITRESYVTLKLYFCLMKIRKKNV